jgi:hypothetical protein
VSVVGTGLRRAEDPSSRDTRRSRALKGAVHGAVLGLLFACLFGLFFPDAGVGLLGLLVYGLASGTLFGALLGVLAHLAADPRPAILPAPTRADRYELHVDDAVADEAERLLRALPEVPRL